MSPRLALQFLGIPQLNLDTTPIVTDRRKAVALLAYLAMNRGKQTREFLSGLFWPEYEQAKAFSNLRRTIWEVHQATGEGWLIADRESVELNRRAEIDLDVANFQDLLTKSHQSSDPAYRIPLLTNATTLYRNHFLTGFSLKDSHPFNEWAYAESEELRRQLADALTTLTIDYRTLEQPKKAIPFARRLISLDPLNETSHRQLMEVYLHAGQPSAALKQYQTCEHILRKELNLDPQPETHALYKKILKEPMKPIRIEEKVQDINPKHNLPLRLSSFVGREKEIGDVKKLLAKHRLVTLAGMGGIGKTRLSLQMGLNLISNYPDGVWFIALDSLFDPNLIPQTVAAVFEIREASDQPTIELLKNVLRNKIALIILDNCEHLLNSCAQLITTLLMNCPNLKILATSREILNVEGEAVYSLPTLTIPEDSDSLEKLTNYESVQLFIERAALAQSSFMFTIENAPTVLEICRKVDGIPLAIELAAARINIFHVKEILSQLNESFALLASNGRKTLPRQQTLQASMDWSWGLLHDEEHIFLRQLSVFAGGWTLDAAQAVCDGDVLSLTSELVKKSLIAVNQEAARETRFHFHEIVRQYTHEKLVEVGEEGNIRTRHLRYFLHFSEKVELPLGHLNRDERLKDERDNIRAALEWANRTDVEAGLYLAGRLGQLWENHDLREGARWLVNFLDKPESKKYPHARAKALCTWAWLLLWLQQFDQNQKAAQECLDLYRACDDKRGEIDGLLAGGSLEQYQQALALSKSLGDKAREAQALVNLGWNDIDYHRRVRYMERAIELSKESGRLESALEPMTWLGNFEIANGNLQAAQKWVREVTTASQNLNHKNMKADILTLYGNMALIMGEYDKAHIYLDEAATICEGLGFRWGLLWANVRLGYVALRQGNLPQARKKFAETARMFQEDQFANGVVYTLEGIAGANILVHKMDQAARLIGWADAMRKQIDDPRPLLEQADVDKIITACVLKMGEVAFSEAYDESQKMTLDEAVAYALKENI